MNFKVGDEIVLIKHDSYWKVHREIPIGTHGIIKDFLIDDDKIVVIEFLNFTIRAYTPKYCIELAVNNKELLKELFE